VTDAMNTLPIVLRLMLAAVLAATLVALALYTSASWVARRVR
jgi:hypothetical protein